MGMKRLFTILEDEDQGSLFKQFVKKKKYGDLVSFAVKPDKSGDVYARYFSPKRKVKIMPKTILEKAAAIYKNPTDSVQNAADGIYKACAHNDKEMAKIRSQMESTQKTIKLLTKANKKKKDPRVIADIAKKEKEVKALDKQYKGLAKAVTDMAKKRDAMLKPGSKGKDKEFKALVDEAHAIIYKQVDPGIVQEFWKSSEYRIYQSTQAAHANRGM